MKSCIVCGQPITMPGIDFHQQCGTYVYGQGWIPNTNDRKDDDR